MLFFRPIKAYNFTNRVAGLRVASIGIAFFGAVICLKAQPPSTLRMPPVASSHQYLLTNAFGSLGIGGNPVAIVTPPGETNRLFVVHQVGVISVITNLAVPTRTTFLDIRNRVRSNLPPQEYGLLGMAFHPGYATNRKFYVFYTTTATSSQGPVDSLHDRLSKMLA